MQSLTIVLFATLAIGALCVPSGHWGHGDDGQWHGDGGHHWDDGQWHGDGGHWGGHDGAHWDGNDGGHWGGHDGAHWDDGHWDDGHHGHHSDVVHAHNAVLLGASEHVNQGHGHGIVVRGPPTAPVTIVGPSGKVHAKGLWGPTHKGVHHW